MKKKLRLSNNKIFAGVCAGFAEFFEVDPTLVRVIYTLATLFTAFSGVIVYIILWILLPENRRRY